MSHICSGNRFVLLALAVLHSFTPNISVLEPLCIGSLLSPPLLALPIFKRTNSTHVFAYKETAVAKLQGWVRCRWHMHQLPAVAALQQKTMSRHSGKSQAVINVARTHTATALALLTKFDSTRQVECQCLLNFKCIQHLLEHQCLSHPDRLKQPIVSDQVRLSIKPLPLCSTTAQRVTDRGTARSVPFKSGVSR